MRNKLTTFLIITLYFLVVTVTPINCANRKNNFILSCTWLKSSFGVNQDAIFVWDIKELLSGKKPTLHLVWKGGRGKNPEAAISPDGKYTAISTWNQQRDAQNILLLDLKTKKEEWLTKDFGEQFFIHWINNRLLLIYNIPHKINGKFSIQIWDIKNKKMIKEIDTQNLFSPPKNAHFDLINIAPSELDNHLIFINWIQEKKFKEYIYNNEKTLYLPIYPYQIAWLEKNNFKIVKRIPYPAINNLPYPPKQHFDISPNGTFAFITDVFPTKEASYPEKNLIRIMKLENNNKTFKTLFTILPSNNIVQYDSVKFFDNNYLIFSEKEIKNNKTKYYVAVYDVSNKKEWKFEPTWNGKNIALVNHKVVPDTFLINSFLKNR